VAGKNVDGIYTILTSLPPPMNFYFQPGNNNGIGINLFPLESSIMFDGRNRLLDNPWKVSNLFFSFRTNKGHGQYKQENCCGSNRRNNEQGQLQQVAGHKSD
jgi:hypothetical protein